MLCQAKGRKYQTVAEMEMEKWSCVEKFGLWKWLLAMHKMVARGSVCALV